MILTIKILLYNLKLKSHFWSLYTPKVHSFIVNLDNDSLSPSFCTHVIKLRAKKVYPIWKCINSISSSFFEVSWAFLIFVDIFYISLHFFPCFFVCFTWIVIAIYSNCWSLQCYYFYVCFRKIVIVVCYMFHTNQ